MWGHSFWRVSSLQKSLPPAGHADGWLQFAEPQPIKPIVPNQRPGLDAMRRVSDCLKGLFREDAGQDLIEYALVAGLIGLGAVLAMSGLAQRSGTASTALETV